MCYLFCFSYSSMTKLTTNLWWMFRKKHAIGQAGEVHLENGNSKLNGRRNARVHILWSDMNVQVSWLYNTYLQMCKPKLLVHEIRVWKIFSTSMNLVVGRNQAGNVTDSKGLSWFQVEGYWWAYTSQSTQTPCTASKNRLTVKPEKEKRPWYYRSAVFPE